MDTTTLVEKQIANGQALLRALDQENVPVQAALWWYEPEAEEWRFLLATPLLESKGPREVYRKIQAVLETLPSDQRIPLASISVVGLNDERIKALRMLIRTGPGIHRIRLSKNAVNNLFIEDAYVYRVQ